MLAISAEPGRDIAGMGTILPLLIAIALKLPSTMGANRRIKSPPVDQLRVCIPPRIAAGSGAEFPLFLLVRLFKRSAAVPADQYWLRSGYTCQMIPAAKALDGILR